MNTDAWNNGVEVKRLRTELRETRELLAKQRARAEKWKQRHRQVENEIRHLLRAPRLKP